MDTLDPKHKDKFVWTDSEISGDGKGVEIQFATPEENRAMLEAMEENQYEKVLDILRNSTKNS